MEQFIAEVTEYADACRLKPTTVIQRAAGVSGASWASWINGGSSPTLRTVDRVRAYMLANPAPQQSEETAA
jgi:hypothetical protein